MSTRGAQDLVQVSTIAAAAHRNGFLLVLIDAFADGAGERVTHHG